ncbi:MAG: hypothetical protein V4635_17120 [Bacteroidota bacterium]
MFLLSLFFAADLIAQKNFFGEEPVLWESNKPYVIPAEYENYLRSDVVVLEDHTSFYFYSSTNERLVRKIVLRINNKNGLEAAGNHKLPESFDRAYDAHLFKQGRQARIGTPFISEYHINHFAARKFAAGKWSEVPFKLKYETIRWIKSSGEFADDQVSTFQLQNLSIGDIVEIYYDAAFNSNYGSNLFYFNGRYPKLKVEYDFIYKVNKRFAGYAFICPVNIKDSVISKTITDQKEDVIKTDKILLKNLSGINYGANSFESKTIPHVFADFRFYRVVNNSYPVDGGRLYEIDYIRPRNFEWLVIADTNNYYTRIYDKQFASIRKFVSTLPPSGKDSTNKIFFKALCDTFNNFRYISSNHLFYNESNLYDVYSADHLLKRRLIEHSLIKVYKDILNDNKIFYYSVNVQDNRYGEHSLSNRSHYAYENSLICIPNGKSYIYFMPRFNGIKYHLNELPFYFEGSLAALYPHNFQEEVKNKDDKFFKFIKTHKGTFNENTRTENVTVKISIDSLKTTLAIKESLSGQFSTVIRHLYLNEFIDSTIAPLYFKRCTDKPNAIGAKVKLSSHIGEFPFRYTFNCSERIPMQNKQALDIRHWFSFIISKHSFPELPTHDYYFDFDFTDTYNFLLDFDSAVEIRNLANFTKKINNDFFELESEIIKNSDSNYLLKVRLAVKERKIPVEKVGLINELVETLEELNNFSLELAMK